MDEGKVLVPNTELELAHGLYEWGGLDVAHGTTELRGFVVRPNLHDTAGGIPLQCRHQALHHSRLQVFLRRARSSLGWRSSHGARSGSR